MNYLVALYLGARQCHHLAPPGGALERTGVAEERLLYVLVELWGTRDYVNILVTTSKYLICVILILFWLCKL